MKKLFLTSLLNLFLVAGVFAQKEIVVDPNASVRTISAAFNHIKVSNNIKLILSQSDVVSLAVSASEEKYKNQIQTVVENNTLRIFSEEGNWSGSKNRQLTVYLSFKNLEKLDVGGASQVLASNPIKLNTLSIDLSGAAVLRAAIDIQNLTLELSGASKARLSGVANTVSLECSGASDVGAYELTMQTCSATASGASDLQLHVEKALNAVASGASRIYYKGEPTTNIRNSGVSKIEKRL